MFPCLSVCICRFDFGMDWTAAAMAGRLAARAQRGGRRRAPCGRLGRPSARLQSAGTQRRAFRIMTDLRGKARQQWRDPP